jgi:hypothetical protein
MAGMKPRLAAALALVGWYLMIPASTLPPGVAYKEPLRKWQIVRGFDIADECEDFLSTFFEHSREKQALNMLEPTYRDYMFAECVSSDDLRLKDSQK